MTEGDAVAQSTYMAGRLGWFIDGCGEDSTAEERLECLRAMDRDTLMQSMGWGVEETLNIQKTIRATGVIEVADC
jgi:hypothetical protein